MTKGYQIPLEKEQENLRLNPFQMMISIILSARTKDMTTAKVCRTLFKKVKTPADLLHLPIQELLDILHPIGFYNEKAKHIRETAGIISQQGLPTSREKLEKLPGIGPKTAALYSAKVLHQPAICVDTHVFRITNLLLFHKKPSKSAEETTRRLEKMFPKRNWNEINSLLVKFGQNICLPRYPHCNECLFKRECPASSFQNRQS
jgi:endonuclease-3